MTADKRSLLSRWLDQLTLDPLDPPTRTRTATSSSTRRAGTRSTRSSRSSTSRSSPPPSSCQVLPDRARRPSCTGSRGSWRTRASPSGSWTSSSTSTRRTRSTSPSSSSPWGEPLVELLGHRLRPVGREGRAHLTDVAHHNAEPVRLGAGALRLVEPGSDARESLCSVARRAAPTVPSNAPSNSGRASRWRPRESDRTPMNTAARAWTSLARRDRPGGPRRVHAPARPRAGLVAHGGQLTGEITVHVSLIGWRQMAVECGGA